MRAFLPLAIATNSVPILVFAPVAVLIFGFGIASKIAIVVIVCFFPTFSNTLRGLSSLESGASDLLASLGAPRLTVLLKARIPTAAPYLFSALRTTSAISVGVALVAEYFGSGAEGIGAYIMFHIHYLNLAAAFAALGLITGLGLLFYGSIVLLERVVAPWQVGFRAREAQRESRPIAR
jgi:NitT/TauT family transport system permease protein